MPSQSPQNPSRVPKSYPALTQSALWKKTNDLLGFKTYLEDDILMIVKPARRGRFLEIPGGPNINWHDQKSRKNTLSRIRAIAHENHCVFIRLRPNLLDTPEHRALLEKSGLHLAPMHLSAENTIFLDLTKPAETLLAEMRRQTRYEVRRAEKLALSVESSSDESAFRTFHSVQLATARRQNFIPPDLATLLAEHQAFGANALIYTVCTPKDTEITQKSQTYPKSSPIAYGLILIDPASSSAAYYEAASTELNHALPGAYALQWQVIKDLQQQGITSYNLWGIAPPGAKNHRYSGVTTFKTGFGGDIVNFVPAHDLILNPLLYQKTRLIETLRKKQRHL